MSSRGCFVRLGSASEPMSTQMVEELFSSRTRNSIGKIRSNRQDLTFEQLKIYYEAKGLKLNDQFASNLELLTVHNEFNYVAYLMADSNGTSIKVSKYKGLTRVNLVENNEYGYCSLMKSTKQVLEKLELENKTATLITSKERINQKLWNPVALRETVINAIVHNVLNPHFPKGGGVTLLKPSLAIIPLSSLLTMGKEFIVNRIKLAVRGFLVPMLQRGNAGCDAQRHGTQSVPV